YGRAFGPDLAAKDRAPAAGPGRWPGRPGLWDRYLHGLAPAPPDVAEAGRYLEVFEFLSQQWPARYLAADHLGTWTGAVAGVGAGGGGVLAPAALAYLITAP